MVATRDNRLAAVILVAGAYDFATMLPKMDHGVRTNFWLEAGTSPDAFQTRSALYHADKIKSPILLLHGTQDATIPVDQARHFFEKLHAAGAPVRLRIFTGYGHGIPGSVQFKEWGPFVEEYLRSR
jgi:dipeptidyl aminopeptidase/acylaminoacyl peptidase